MPNRVTLHTLRSAYRLLSGSLLQYLAFARPYAAGNDQGFVALLDQLIADERSTISRFSELMKDLGGPETVDFPMRHTGFNDLGVRYTLKVVSAEQREIAAKLRELRDELAFAEEAEALIESAEREAVVRSSQVESVFRPEEELAASAVEGD